MCSSFINSQICMYSSVLTLRIRKAVHLNSGEPGFVGFDLMNIVTPQWF